MYNIRLGYTETTLLFFWYLDQQTVSNKLYLHSQNNLINWLCTTSGFYDKKIKGSYFDFNALDIKHYNIYNEYFTKLWNFLKQNTNNNKYSLQLCFHPIDDNLQVFKEKFSRELGFISNEPEMSLYSFIQNKHILIINNLGSLMKQQFESGNIKQINSNFPANVKSIQYFEPGYTFFNNGPDSSILETSEKLCILIKKYNFDAAIISTGAYSCLIADFIMNILNKDVYIIGGLLPLYFGIKTNRLSNHKNINKYFISVPPEMRPIGYEKIENGCYW